MAYQAENRLTRAFAKMNSAPLLNVSEQLHLFLTTVLKMRLNENLASWRPRQQAVSARSGPHLARMDFTRARCGLNLGQNYVAVWGAKRLTYFYRVISQPISEYTFFKHKKQYIHQVNNQTNLKSVGTMTLCFYLLHVCGPLAQFPIGIKLAN